MLNNLRNFFYFLSDAYLEKIKEVDRNFTRDMLQGMVEVGRKYFPKYGVSHWRRLKDLLADFRPDYPFSITSDRLPRDLLGVYVPFPEGPKKGTVILNTENSYGMHLATVGHENGHLVAHLFMEQNRTTEELPLKPIYANSLDLREKLEDPEEILADYIACMAVYPRESFMKKFCNAQGQVCGPYRRSTLLFFIRSLLYVMANYPELAINFFKTEHKLFHLCQTLHFARLRLLIYQNYRL